MSFLTYKYNLRKLQFGVSVAFQIVFDVSKDLTVDVKLIYFLRLFSFSRALLLIQNPMLQNLLSKMVFTKKEIKLLD